MRKIFFFLLAGALVFGSYATADVDPQDIGATDIQGVRESERGPFKLEISLDSVGKAKIKNRHRDKRRNRRNQKQRHLQFATGEVELSAVFYHDASINEGASIALDYDRSRFDWEHNRFFKQKDFDRACLQFNFSSERLCDWLWKAQLSINFDNLAHWNFNQYMNYDMLLWGRYNYRNVGINLGFLALTGMKIDRVYPVIGIDWKWGPKWTINLVFPTNVSVIYNITHAWAFTIAGRMFFERHRLKHNEVLNKGLIVYNTTGAEFGINYTPNNKLFANIHAGYDFGGRFKRADMHYHNKHNYILEGAPYAGFELDYAF